MWLRIQAEWLMRSSKTNIPDSKKTSTGRRPEGVYNLNSSDVTDTMTLMAGFKNENG